MSFISLIIVKCALKHTGVVAKKSNLIAPLPPLMPHHSGRQWKMAAISVNLDLCGEKENFLFRKMFRSLVCPPAFGPAKRSKNFGPFRTTFPHFRRFAFRFRSLGTPTIRHYMKNEDTRHLLGTSETRKNPKNVISFVTQLELEQRTFIWLNLAWNHECVTGNKAHLLVLCKFSGSVPEVSDSALTIELP
jgi:hypothetical protein